MHEVAQTAADTTHPSELATALAETSRALDQLSLIAQEITACLDVADIFAAIERHVGALLDASSLYIGLIGEDGWIDVPLHVDGGERAAGFRFRLDDPARPAAQAIREKREVAIFDESVEEAERAAIPGTRPTLSALFRPLTVRGRTLGVMSVQSERLHAYGERERLIFRSLCSYAAVALANAESYRRLAAMETLETLGEISQDITASFDFEDIFIAIERHVGALLDTATLYIGLLDDAEQWIDVPLFVDGGKRASSRRIRVDDPIRPAALCIRENREIFREKSEEEARKNDLPGTVPTLTALFGPLIVHGRTFGVMSVQSERPHAYGERERLIFRNLCSYAAVALANAESYRRLAAMETLETLGDVAQEITASLNVEDVFGTLERHVGALFDTSTLYIGLIDQGAQCVEVPFLVEKGQRVIGPRFSIDDAIRPAARAIRENREILLATATPAEAASVMSLEPKGILTGLFRPLVVRERILGVMAILSERPNAFSERQVLVFRTLCAYVAIAVANADAYRQAQQARAQATTALGDLRDAQQSLIQAEKMASLGQLVAGVAHEINTPVGMAFTVATTLSRRAKEFRLRLDNNQVKRSDLGAFLDNVGEAARQLDVNLQRAADLVLRFKEVAVDRTSDERREFDLAGLIDGILASLAPELRRTPHRVEVTAEPGLVLDSYPGSLGQALVNLVLNAAQHAFPDGRTGTIRISAAALSVDRVEVIVADDGIGISQADRARIFDPFFTTRRSSGGTGLGLHIAFNLVTQTLRGRLHCVSNVGNGTIFRLTLPIAPPESGATDHREPVLIFDAPGSAGI